MAQCLEDCENHDRDNVPPESNRHDKTLHVPRCPNGRQQKVLVEESSLPNETLLSLRRPNQIVRERTNSQDFLI